MKGITRINPLTGLPIIADIATDNNNGDTNIIVLISAYSYNSRSSALKAPVFISQLIITE